MQGAKPKRVRRAAAASADSTSPPTGFSSTVLDPLLLLPWLLPLLPLLCVCRLVLQLHVLGETCARPPWAEVAETAALEPASPRAALRSPA